MSTVYVGGTFDLFHMGHVELLREAWYLSRSFDTPTPPDRVVVALNTDQFVEDYKGKRPVCSYEERKAVLEACRYVDEVIENTGGYDSKPAIVSVDPHYLCVGSDWTLEAYKTQMGITDKWLDAHEIQIRIIARTTGCSSSAIKERL